MAGVTEDEERTSADGWNDSGEGTADARETVWRSRITSLDIGAGVTWNNLGERAI